MSLNKPIKLAVNTTSLLSPLTGIGRYTHHLCKYFQKSNDVELLMFYGHDWTSAMREQPVKNIVSIKNKIKKFIPYSYSLMRTLQNRRFKKRTNLNDLDIYHDPNYLLFDFPGKKIITVHDLSFKRFPDAHPLERIRALDRYFPKSLEQADAIITDSYFSARELVEIYSVDTNKVYPIHLGVEKRFKPRSYQESLETLSKYQLEYCKYILVVGTLEPRKNLSQALLSYSALPDEVRATYPLVITGMKGWGTSDLESQMKPLIEKGQLRLTGYVPDEDLPYLYSGAKVFLYPSLYEGFGLPPLEAMASGVPVITSNQASLPEVVGNAGIQVFPGDTIGLQTALLSLLESPDRCQELIQLGLEQASKFTWERCAEETLAVYKSVLAE